jgi:hypothetical protein
MVQAPAPPRPFDAGMASTALVSWVVASKFAWHMPLHRQTQMLAGYGVTLDRSTLVHWVDRAAWWLQGVYDQLLTHIHAAGRVYCDETPQRISGARDSYVELDIRRIIPSRILCGVSGYWPIWLKLSAPGSLKIIPGVAAVSADAWGTAVQILFRTMSDVATYVRQKEWRGARLQRCPLHPGGGCSLRRHGTYERTSPQGIRVARWYCPEGRRTFSLLPDFLCVRLPGLLSSVETAVCAATLYGSIEAAADALRQDDVSLPSAVRWLRRRMRALAAQRVWRSQQDMGADQARVGDEVDPPTRDAIRCKAHHKDSPIQEICRPLSRSSTSGGGTWLFKTAAPEHICTG